MRFVETPVFTTALQRHLDDDQYRQLQIALMLRPEQGLVIRTSGGLRKMRWAKPGAGKWGGLRVIYFWAPAERAFFALCLLQGGARRLDAGSTRGLGRLLREEFK
jgi:hypothetical protein